jgi:hypothetical protein
VHDFQLIFVGVGAGRDDCGIRDVIDRNLVAYVILFSVQHFYHAKPAF